MQPKLICCTTSICNRLRAVVRVFINKDALVMPCSCRCCQCYGLNDGPNYCSVLVILYVWLYMYAFLLPCRLFSEPLGLEIDEEERTRVCRDFFYDTYLPTILAHLARKTSLGDAALYSLSMHFTYLNLRTIACRKH